MYRYLTLLGVGIIVFSVAGGTIQISNSYNEHQSLLHVSGVPGSNLLTVLDEARWQAARLIGSGVIAGGIMARSLLMALAWIGKILEEARVVLARDIAD